MLPPCPSVGRQTLPVLPLVDDTYIRRCWCRRGLPRAFAIIAIEVLFARIGFPPVKLAAACEYRDTENRADHEATNPPEMHGRLPLLPLACRPHFSLGESLQERSEERRVGKECAVEARAW